MNAFLFVMSLAMGFLGVISLFTGLLIATILHPELIAYTATFGAALALAIALTAKWSSHGK